MSWRYQGGPGSGVLADIGSHLVDLAEFFCGPTTGVAVRLHHDGHASATTPLGAAVGHAAASSSATTRAGGERGRRHLHHPLRHRRGGHVLAVPGRLRPRQHPAPSTCSARTAPRKWDMDRPAEFTIIRQLRDDGVNGYSQVFVGPSHPYIKGGLPMDFPGVWPRRGTTSSSSRPARSSTRSPASRAACRRSRPSPTACTTSRPRRRRPSAATGGAVVDLPAPTTPPDPDQTASTDLKEHHEARRLHRLPARQAARRDPEDPRRLGLTSAEINSGGFIAARHLPIDDLLASAGAREEYLGEFAARAHADRR